MMPHGDDGDNAKRLLANPYYAISFADSLFEPHDVLPQEDWIVLNAKLLEDIGPKPWLAELLTVLADTSATGVHDGINPSRVVRVSKRLAGTHDPVIDLDAWVAANAKLIAEVGIPAWLELLLHILEYGGYDAGRK